jgi:hypothetical protein
VVYGFFAVGTGFGAVSYGIAFTRMGDYRLALMSSSAMLVVSGILMIALGRYRYPKGAVIALAPAQAIDLGATVPRQKRAASVSDVAA